MQQLFQEIGPVTAVIGAQWGDEGKGKIIDILAPQFDVIARAGGGANAGHTIVVRGRQRIFHLLPSGCLREGRMIVLGSGMVIHPPTLLQELAALKEGGIDILPRLWISQAAHIVFDYHQRIDGVIEERRPDGGDRGGIGTTKRGIGPAYADKAYRTGMRMGDLAAHSEHELKRLFRHNASFVHAMFDVGVSGRKELEQLNEAKELFASRVTDTVAFLHGQREHGKTILIEGAQGTLLDSDHGTYPYVTSSATTSSGALHGLGLPPQALTSCIGIVKSYCTRVGGGPFPTEATPADAERLRGRGSEYGATTGRPRRCGWLSVTDLKRAAAINGFTHLNLTKLDVLDTEEKIPVFVGDRRKELPGWKEPTKGVTAFEKLPKNAQRYVAFIEEETGLPVPFIGTGQGREEMVVRS